MPRLYIDEYAQALAGQTVCIACREGILRDHVTEIISDVKLLNKLKINTILYHNVANRSANRTFCRELSDRLPECKIVRIAADVDFYAYVLDQQESVHKLIFLERKGLVDQRGRKINTITTQGVRKDAGSLGDLVANTNFKGILDRICTKIDTGFYKRVHILPAAKNAIKFELFTIEGFGTLIANNFVESFQPVSSETDVNLINGILKLYKNEGYLKPRTTSYLRENRANFYVTLVDNIVVGCVEKKIIDRQTVEIAALAISTRFRNHRVGVFTVNSFVETIQRQGYFRFISLTNNPRLIQLYRKLGFSVCDRLEYPQRQADSPGVAMLFKEMDKRPF